MNTWDYIRQIADYDKVHDIPSENGVVLEEECAEYIQAICKNRRENQDGFSYKQYMEAVDVVIAAFVYFASNGISREFLERTLQEKAARVVRDPSKLSHS